MARLALKKPLSKERRAQIEEAKKKAQQARIERNKKEAFELLKMLREKYEVFGKFLPLKVGIVYQIRKAKVCKNRDAVAIALNRHAHDRKYLRNVINGDKRYDLKGRAVQDIYEAHKQHASEMLKVAEQFAAKRKKAKGGRK